MQFSYIWIWLELCALILKGNPLGYHREGGHAILDPAEEQSRLTGGDEWGNVSMAPGTWALDVPALDATSLMQRDGAQPGRVTRETAEILENVLRGKIVAVRDRNRGKARNLLWLLSGFVRRGLQSRVEGVRQMSRLYEYVREEFWPSVHEHSNSVANWVEDFWRTARNAARRASKEHKRRVALQATNPHGWDEEMVLDIWNLSSSEIVTQCQFRTGLVREHRPIGVQVRDELMSRTKLHTR